jgi:hypothetical protein
VFDETDALMERYHRFLKDLRGCVTAACKSEMFMDLLESYLPGVQPAPPTAPKGTREHVNELYAIVHPLALQNPPDKFRMLHVLDAMLREMSEMHGNFMAQDNPGMYRALVRSGRWGQPPAALVGASAGA